MATFALSGAAYTVRRIGELEQWRGRHLGGGGWAVRCCTNPLDHLEANMSKQIGYKIRQCRWSTAAVLVLIISLAGAACSPSTADAPSQASPATQAAVPTVALPTVALPTAALPTAAQPTAAPTLAAPTLAPTASPAPSSTTQPTELPAVTAGPEAQGLIATFTSNGNLLIFNQDGTWLASWQDQAQYHGTFTVVGDQVTFIEVAETGPCSPTDGPGVYRWVLTGMILSLTVVRDDCADRAGFMVNFNGVWSEH